MSASLLEGFLRLLGQWEGVFCQHRSLWKAQRHALGLLLTMGTVQISRVLCTLGLAGRDWSAEYRQFSRGNWNSQDCFGPVSSSMPTLKKPDKKATEEQREQYRQQKRQRPAMAASRQAIIDLRNTLDEHGAHEQSLSLVLDGSFANRVLLAEPIERTHIICRCRRNARLRFGKTADQSGRFYAPGTFSPDSIRTNHEAYPFSEAPVRLSGRAITVRFKDIGNVYWPGTAKRRPLRLLMVAQLHHKAKGTKGQAPTFDSDTYHIITTDLQRPALQIIQAAFDRWQIEVAHREEKSVFGIGDAQVRNALSVERHPAFAVACYSMLHLAAIDLLSQDKQQPHIPLPKWRKRYCRPSVQTLLNVLRSEIQNNPTTIAHWGIKPHFEHILKAAAA